MMLNLKFSNQKKPSAVDARQRDPLDIFRDALVRQIDAVKAAQNNKQTTQTKTRYYDGKKVEIEVPIRPWWWLDQNTYHLTLRYSSQPILIKDHPTIICGNTLASVETTLTHILEALDARDDDLCDGVMVAYHKACWKRRR